MRTEVMLFNAPSNEIPFSYLEEDAFFYHGDYLCQKVSASNFNTLVYLPTITPCAARDEILSGKEDEVMVIPIKKITFKVTK